MFFSAQKPGGLFYLVCQESLREKTDLFFPTQKEWSEIQVLQKRDGMLFYLTTHSYSKL